MIHDTTTTTDEWVKSAMDDTHLVVNLLVKLRHQSSSSSVTSHLKRWSTRQRRTKQQQQQNNNNVLISTTGNKTPPPRASPTTPLSSYSSGGCGEESSLPNLDGGDISRSKDFCQIKHNHLLGVTLPVFLVLLKLLFYPCLSHAIHWNNNIYLCKQNNVTDSEGLVAKFSAQEIKEAVFSCGDERAPGPDGFPFKFVKKFWEFFEHDFQDVFDSFFDQGLITRGCNSAFISLIPKTVDPVNLNDYRPITLVGIMGKVLSKVLANRLKRVLSPLISINQTAFLSDRLIIDGPLILNEIFAWTRHNKKKAFFFKVDFNKAFDNVNWGFLDSVMEQMGFPRRWRDWISGILNSSRAAVLVNGAPTEEFQCLKGLRQGDPLSPFLFLIAMEALSSMLKMASLAGVYSGISLPNNGPTISHLLYADDCMFVGEWEHGNIKNVVRILRIFRICSGLHINFGKSQLFGLGITDEVVRAMATSVHCNSGPLPFEHLGIKIGSNMNRISNWHFLIETFKKRLSRWKATCLSIGGRVTLIKSVLENLPTYYFSLFKAPKKIIDSLENIMRRFLWGGTGEANKINWVAWERVASPINMGGLGISSLAEANVALLSKWIWRFRTEPKSLWRSVICAIHDLSGCWTPIPVCNRISGVWKNIVKACSNIKAAGVGINHLFKGTCGNGESIRFWIDPWACNVPLKDIFPRLFKRESDKKCVVKDRFKDGVLLLESNGVDDGRLLSREEVAEAGVLKRVVESKVMIGGSDRWDWLGHGQRFFSVKAVKRFLGSDKDYSNRWVLKWCKWLPKKCNIFMWRLGLDRLQTAMALDRRNCGVGSNMCGLCDADEEDVDHLFCSCWISAQVWFRVSRWCNTKPLLLFSTKDLFDLHKYVDLDKKRRSTFKGIIFTTCWCLWRARNRKRFANENVEAERIFQEVKSLGFLWFKNRCKSSGSVNWSQWCKFEWL